PRAVLARRPAISFASGRRTIPGRRITAGSLNRLNRNGSTASSRSGPPRLNRTTARLVIASRIFVAVHEVEQGLDMLGRGVGQDAMTEMENERAVAQSRQNVVGRLFHCRSTLYQKQRVEIALYRAKGLEHRSGDRQWHHLVETQRGHSGFGEIGSKHQPRAARKSNDRHTRMIAPQRRDDFFGRCDNPLAELRFRQNPGPTVEQLNYLGAGTDL